jgi:hypothetical protein
MKDFLKRMFSYFRGNDRVVIEQESHYDAMEEEVRRVRESCRAVERAHGRIAQAVGSWSRDTVSNRCRVPITRAVGRDCAAWLPGLGVQEIINLSRASAFDVQHHIFGEDRIPGVRPVQPLPESVLIWPRPRLVANPKEERGAGGGPRLKSRKFG